LEQLALKGLIMPLLGEYQWLQYSIFQRRGRVVGYSQSAVVLLSNCKLCVITGPVTNVMWRARLLLLYYQKQIDIDAVVRWLYRHAPGMHCVVRQRTNNNWPLTTDRAGCRQLERPRAAARSIKCHGRCRKDAAARWGVRS